MGLKNGIHKIEIFSYNVFLQWERGMMYKKKVFCSVIFIGMILWIIVDSCRPDHLFSAGENRLLQQKPLFSGQGFLEETYQQEYEKYLSDQFLFRDKWVSLKTRLEILSGKKEINGVYLANDGSLIERHLPSEIDADIAEKKLYELNNFIEMYEHFNEKKTGETDIKVMLVPTADIIYREKLPPYAGYFDQTAYLDKGEDILGENHLINVEAALSEHSDEYLYYRTDHHWTTLGAFYGYQKYCEVMEENSGISFQRTEYVLQTVSDDFCGSLARKTQLYKNPDEIILYRMSEDQDVKVCFDGVYESGRGIYDFDAVASARDQYEIFFGGNHGIVEIERECENQKTLLVIKDSYANSLIPFLIPDYEEIVIVDPRYYRGNIKNLIWDGNFTQILILYNVIHFIDA